MTPPISSREWLEADGLGGFASGTATGIRTRRYHALLLTATTPPTGRVALAHGFDAWVETPAGTFMLSTQCYAPGVPGGDSAQRIESFQTDPWPTWTFQLEDGTRLRLEIMTVRDQPVTTLVWTLLGPAADVRLHLRPFLSGRDYHSLHRRNPAFRFEADIELDRVSWRPYADLPGITALTHGQYIQSPHWYENFLYEEEQARGLDCIEDLAAPGVFSWNLAHGRASLLLTTRAHADAAWPSPVDPDVVVDQCQDAERRRRKAFPTRLHAAADAYLVRRGAGRTLIAGYPWFTDWGRDTLIALRGICLATGRLEEARDILLAWAATVSEGMLPNRFPDQGGQPEFNAVDASLWMDQVILGRQAKTWRASEPAPHSSARRSTASRSASSPCLQPAHA